MIFRYLYDNISHDVYIMNIIFFLYEFNNNKKYLSTIKLLLNFI